MKIVSISLFCLFSWISYGNPIQLSSYECTKLAKQYFADGDFLRACPLALKGDQNDPELLRILGFMHFSGVGVEGNNVAATNYLWRSFTLGENSSGLFLVEKILLPQRNFTLAEQILLKLVAQKNAAACRLLGDLNTIRSVPDIEKAGEWYAKSVDVTMSPSEYEFEAYGEWLFFHKPYTLHTRDVLKKAADSNLSKAQYYLARVYCSGGTDFSKDLKLAARYFTRVKDNKNCSPVMYADAICSLSTLKRAEGDFESAEKMLKLLFEDTKAIGKTNRGYVAVLICDNYLETKKDIVNAEKWANIACEYGVWEGVALCGQFYHSRGDLLKAVEYYDKAASNGSAMGMVALAQSNMIKDNGNIDTARQLAEEALKKSLQNYRNYGLIHHGRMIAENVMGGAYCALVMLEKKEGNEKNAVKLILDGVSRVPNHAVLTSLLGECVREGRISHDTIDFKQYLSVLRLNAKYDDTGFFSQLLAQYLTAHPDMKNSVDEVEQLYKHAASKGNSAAIVHLATEINLNTELTKEEKEKLYQLLMSARKSGENDVCYDRVVVMLKYGADKGWWESPRNVTQVGIKDELAKFAEAAMLMERGLGLISPSINEAYCCFYKAKKKLQTIKSHSEVGGYTPVYISICDLMCGNNVEKSLAVLEEYAQRGNLQATEYLYVAYAGGIYVNRNLEKARKLIALLENNAKEMSGLNIGEQLVTPEKIMTMKKIIEISGDGTVTIVDHRQAAQKIIREAEKKALNGDISAKVFLMTVYRNGWPGVVIDMVRAEKLLKEVMASCTSEELCTAADLSYEGFSRKGLVEDWPLSIMLYKAAVDKGNAVAANNLALMYEKGEGCDKNMDRAFELFLKAAEGGCVEAQISVGNHYEFYHQGEDALKKALYWYEKAMENGSPDAKVCLKRIRKRLNK